MTIRLKKRTKDMIAGYSFILPTFIGVMTFSIIPIILSFILSFTAWNFAGTPHFVGLKNYMGVFQDELFWKAFLNTIYYTVLTVPGTLIVALILALAINRIDRVKSFFRSVFYLPVITNSVAVSMVWIWIYEEKFGVLNALLGVFGIKGPAWLIQENLVLPSIAIMSIWWGAGYQMLLFLAGLQSISRTYYEAADIDGASAFTKLFRITIPLLSPTIFFAGITAIISSFQVFDQAFVMTDGGPDYASHTLVLHIYRKAFQFMEVGAANSVASILFIMILIITIVQMVFQKKWVFYEGD